MSRVAVIPARGGSKRIKRKNIKLFNGKPIIFYSIDVALRSNLFDEVVVSTDDGEIAEYSVSQGASVPFMRSKKNANDFATTVQVLNEVNDKLRELNRSFDEACCIYPTAPFVTIDHLKMGFDLLGHDVYSVFPVVQFAHPIWRAIKVNGNGFNEVLWPQNSNIRTQDLEIAYHDVGQWYWYRPSLLKDTMFTDRSKSVILREMEVQDIDTEEDWSVAEFKYKFLNG